jgi:hypothetical protein
MFQVMPTYLKLFLKLIAVKAWFLRPQMQMRLSTIVIEIGERFVINVLTLEQSWASKTRTLQLARPIKKYSCAAATQVISPGRLISFSIYIVDMFKILAGYDCYYPTLSSAALSTFLGTTSIFPFDNSLIIRAF